MAARQMHTKTAYHAEMIISLIRLSEEKENDDDDNEPIENVFFSILSHRILIGD